MKKQSIIIVVISLIVIGVITLIIINLNSNNFNNNLNNNYSNNNSSNNLDGKLVVYKYNENTDSYCLEQGNIVCVEVALEIPVSNIITSSLLDVNNNYLLYKDGDNLILFDLKKETKIKNLNLPANYNKYNLFVDENKEIVGLTYSDNESNGYYNIITEEIFYQNKYDELEIDRFSAVNDIPILIGKTKIDDKLYKKVLLDLDQEKELIAEEVNPDYQDYNIIKFEEGNYYSSWHGSPVGHYSRPYDIYSRNLQKIVSNITEVNFHFDLDGKLYVYADGVITKYDIDGNKIYSKNFGEIKEIAYNYCVKVKDNNLVLININDGTEIKLIEWKDEYYYHSTATYKKDGRITLNVGYNDEYEEFEASVITIDIKTLKVDIKETTIGGY